MDNDYARLSELKRDLSGKMQTYNTYINQKKDPPKELEISIDSLQRRVSTLESFIKVKEYNKLRDESKGHGRR